MSKYLQRLIRQTGIKTRAEGHKETPVFDRATSNQPQSTLHSSTFPQEISETRFTTPGTLAGLETDKRDNRTRITGGSPEPVSTGRKKEAIESDPQTLSHPMVETGDPDISPSIHVESLPGPDSIESVKVETTLTPPEARPPEAVNNLNQETTSSDVSVTHIHAIEEIEQARQLEHQVEQFTPPLTESSALQERAPETKTPGPKTAWVNVYDRVSQWVSETPGPADTSQVRLTNQPPTSNPPLPEIKTEDFQLSIGAINLTIEEPPKPVQPPPPAPRQQPPPAAPRRSRLSRYYLRNS